MDRRGFQSASRARRAEARLLLAAGKFSGAYYLAGYSVECALKACVSKQFKRHDLPDRQLVTKAYTHDLEALLKLAGLEADLREAMRSSKALEVNWALVKDWQVDVRYQTGITKQFATDYYSACASKMGVLLWIMARW